MFFTWACHSTISFVMSFLCEGNCSFNTGDHAKVKILFFISVLSKVLNFLQIIEALKSN